MIHIFIFPFVRPGESHQRSLMILSRDSSLYHLIHILEGAPKTISGLKSISFSITEQAVSFGSQFLSSSLATHKSPSVGPQAITGIAQLYANYHIYEECIWTRKCQHSSRYQSFTQYETLVQSCIGLPCPSPPLHSYWVLKDATLVVEDTKLAKAEL